MKKHLFMIAVILAALTLTMLGCPTQPTTEDLPAGETEEATDEAMTEDEAMMEDEEEHADTEETSEKPDAEGAAIWAHLSIDNPYKEWDFWPGKTEFYEGTEPHGALLTTYVNHEAKDAIDAKQGTMPAGSIIVKENYMPDKMLDHITVMYKVEGFNPDANDWFWVNFKPSGEIDGEGKVGACINCHQGQKDNDYIFTGELK